MHPGVAAFALITLGLMAILAFFIFLDYHERSNVHRAVLFVVSLFAAVVLVMLLPTRLLLLLAGFVPLLLLAYVLIARRRWRCGRGKPPDLHLHLVDGRGHNPMPGRQERSLGVGEAGPPPIVPGLRSIS